MVESQGSWALRCQLGHLGPPQPQGRDFPSRTSVSKSVIWGSCEHSISISRKYLINRQFLFLPPSSFSLASLFQPILWMVSLLLPHAQDQRSPFYFPKSNYTHLRAQEQIPSQPSENFQHLNHSENLAKFIQLI